MTVRDGRRWEVDLDSVESLSPYRVRLFLPPFVFHDGVERRRDHMPRELSIGEMQRVAIARALVSDPALVIADEPTGELDTASGAEIIALLIALCHQHRTAVLVATHDVHVVAAATRRYAIRDSVLIHEPT